MLLYVYCSQMASRFVQRKDDRQEYSGNDILSLERTLSKLPDHRFVLKKEDIFVFIFHLISTYLLFCVSPADSHLFRDPSLNPLNAHPQSASWWADREEQGDSLRVCYNKFKSTDLCFRLRRQGELFPSRSS